MQSWTFSNFLKPKTYSLTVGHDKNAHQALYLGVYLTASREGPPVPPDALSFTWCKSGWPSQGQQVGNFPHPHIQSSAHDAWSRWTDLHLGCMWSRVLRLAWVSHPSHFLSLLSRTQKSSPWYLGILLGVFTASLCCLSNEEGEKSLKTGYLE